MEILGTIDIEKSKTNLKISIRTTSMSYHFLYLPNTEGILYPVWI